MHTKGIVARSRNEMFMLHKHLIKQFYRSLNLDLLETHLLITQFQAVVQRGRWTNIFCCYIFPKETCYCSYVSTCTCCHIMVCKVMMGLHTDELKFQMRHCYMYMTKNNKKQRDFLEEKPRKCDFSLNNKNSEF